MDSTRQNKIERLLQKNISEIFQLESRKYFGNAMATITKVRVSSDLSLAKVYISIFTPANTDKNTVIENARLHIKEIKHKLGTKIKNQLRAIPELDFYIDDSLDYIGNIEDLLKIWDLVRV